MDEIGTMEWLMIFCIGMLLLGLTVWVVQDRRHPGSYEERCARIPGHGISYEEKKLCILQDIANNLKNER